MTGLIACTLAFVITAAATMQSLWRGVAVALAVGYVHGIFRANNLSPASAFLFDAAILGLYTVEFTRRVPPEARRAYGLANSWIVLLVAWPMLMLLVPVQPFFVRLVGFRAAVWFLPMILIGIRLNASDLSNLTKSLAMLNVLSLGAAVYIYAHGVESLFPENEVTYTIYVSNDVAGYTARRIPATFSNAHTYGTTMVYSLALVCGGFWADRRPTSRVITLAGALAAAIGIFLCGARSPVVALVASIALLVVFSRLSLRTIILVGFLGLITGVLVARDPRMQRFLTLSDTEMVARRLEISANFSLLEIIKEFPMGAGLARSWGTSIPGFLQGGALPPIGLENEVSRLWIELGPIGVVLFLAFWAWLFVRPPRRSVGPWGLGATFAYAVTCVSTATCFIGVGLLTSIPASAMYFLMIGIMIRARGNAGSRPPLRGRSILGQQAVSASRMGGAS